MKKDKLVYEAPEAEIYAVRIEGRVLMGSPDGTWDKSIRGGTSWDSPSGDDPYGLE